MLDDILLPFSIYTYIGFNFQLQYNTDEEVKIRNKKNLYDHDSTERFDPPTEQTVTSYRFYGN